MHFSSRVRHGGCHFELDVAVDIERLDTVFDPPGTTALLEYADFFATWLLCAAYATHTRRQNKLQVLEEEEEVPYRPPNS
eukprot:6692552-Prymnesium_polylepis.1